MVIPSEDQEQTLFVQWFRRTYEERIYSIPNGGHRHPAVAAKMKATGTTPGVPDLHVPAWNLWIEMKRQKGGRLSVHQMDWISYLESIDHIVIVGNGFEDARAKVQQLGKTPSK